MPPRISPPMSPPVSPPTPLSPGGPGPLGLVALALAILAAGLLLEGHPVDASVSPRIAQPGAAGRPLPSSETMLRDMAGRD